VSLTRRYLKHDSDGAGNFAGLKEMSDSEFIRIAAVTGESFAKEYDSTHEGNIVFTNTSLTTNADSIGRIMDNYYTDADGTDIDNVTKITETLFLAMQNVTFGDANSGVNIDQTSVGFEKQLPLVVKTGQTNTTLESRSFTSGAGATATNELLDDLIVKIFSNDLPGTYYLADSWGLKNAGEGIYHPDEGRHYPDSDKWQILGTEVEQRNVVIAEPTRIFQKHTLVSGSATHRLIGRKVNPMLARVDGSNLLTDLKAAGDSDYARILSSAICKRIAFNQLNDGIGKLVLAHEPPSVDYRQLGTGHGDFIRSVGDITVDIGPNNFSRVLGPTNFARVLGPTNFARVLGPTNFGRTNSSNFNRGGLYPTNYSGTRTTNYSGTRTVNYSGTRTVNYSGTRTANYSGTRTTTYAGIDYSQFGQELAQFVNLYVKIT